jgi:hypothetical protein
MLLSSAGLLTATEQRFVAELADTSVRPLWKIPVKHLGRLRDIDNISTSGPFELTLTTFERAVSNYGSRRDFHFQLKEPLEEHKYNELWTRIQFGRKP